MSNIESIQPGVATTATAQTTPVENPGAVLDRDAFLKLLVAQLKYQDPTKPADTSQMVAQSAQLTMVERLNDIATAMQDGAASDKLSLAGSLVGKNVTFKNAVGLDVTERVDAVRFEEGELTVQAGNHSVPIDAVIAVSAPPAATAPADASSLAALLNPTLGSGLTR
jgi:flagellar hook assembly protein FlgD